MASSDRAVAPSADDTGPGTRRGWGGWGGPGERAGLIATSVVVTATLLAQAPGRILPETKLDVLVDPFRYLGRALAAWDPSGGFGRVQNQAVGYLFPMGAWTSLGRLLHVPVWITQRGWIALVVLAAFWGAHRLAGLIGIGTAWGRLVAAWAYALAPATMATAAFQSAGQLPYSLAPWVLIPLVGSRDGDRPRRIAARSGLAVLAMGGVNGGSTFAVLPLVAVWFLTGTGGKDRRRLFGWWCGAVVAATLWWIVPLLISVRYGVKFTAYTETPALTTSTESATEILRGTGNWLSYLPTRTGYWLPGARSLAVDRWAIVGSTIAAALGLAGLARRDAPGRSWLGPAALLGVVAIGIGYGGSAGGSFAPLAQHLLTGPLAPFRNVHKFAAVVRLPLALGLGHLVASWRRPVRSGPSDEAGARAGVGRTTVARASVPVLAVVAILLAIAPAIGGRLTAPGSFDGLPVAWRDAARWLDGHDDGRRTLVLPGSAFGEYHWGRPLDEPLATLIHTDWAVRDLIPLGGNGSTRLLDGLDTALLGDHLPPGFVTALQRAGVGHVLVRNDLDLPRTGGPGPTTMRRLLATAPSLRRVASFGPVEASIDTDGRVGPAPGDPSLSPIRQLDIYAVPDAVDRVTSYPAAATVVGGGPEALVGLPPAVSQGRAVVLAVDEPPGVLPSPRRVATDTARRRDVIFGAVRGNVTYTLTPPERSPFSGDPPVDRWAGTGPEGLTTARLSGVATLTDDAPRGDLQAPEHQPGSAFDGDLRTAWVPKDPATGHWVEVTFDRARSIPSVAVTIPSTIGERVDSVTVTTDHGAVTGVIDSSGSIRLSLPAGPTRRVRVTIASLVSGIAAAPVGLAEIDLAGVHIERSIVTAPVGPGGRADLPAVAAYLQRLQRDRFDRFRTDEEGVLDREVDLAAGTVALTGTATAQPGPALDALLRAAPTPADVATAGSATSGPRLLTASATSRWKDLPTFDASGAVDGDPGTAWISDPQPTAPALAITWRGSATVDGVTLVQAPGADGASLVVITVGGRQTTRSIPASGSVTFPPVTTDHLTLSFPATVAGGNDPRLVGLTDVSIHGLPGARAVRPPRSTTIDLPCGRGPTIVVDGTTVATRARPTVGQLLDAAPVAWTACSAVDLRVGQHHVLGSATGALTLGSVSIEPVSGSGGPTPAGAGTRSTRVASWGDGHRIIDVGAGPETIVATTENANAGWRASFGGHELRPIRVDGWRQGWIVPAGASGTLHLDFTPATYQSAGLFIALVAVILLFLAAFVGGRGSATWSRPASRAWPEAVLLALAALVGVALAGPAVVLLLPLLVLPHRARLLPLVGAVAAVAAGVVALIAPDAAITNHIGTLSTPAQLLATLAWLALAAALLPDRHPRRGSEPAGSPSDRSG